MTSKAKATSKATSKAKSSAASSGTVSQNATARLRAATKDDVARLLRPCHFVVMRKGIGAGGAA